MNELEVSGMPSLFANLRQAEANRLQVQAVGIR